MIRSTLIILFQFFSLLSFAQTSQPIVVGQTFELASSLLNEKRIINIYLPDGYKDSDTTRYDVIYLPDGGIEEDFLHIAGLVRFNNQPWIARFPNSILVGIENTNRRNDFTFPVNNLDFVEKTGFKKEAFKKHGGSSRYIGFLEKELIPFIDHKFKTNKKRTIIGESLAGLLLTEILLKHRNLFDTYIIMSPSLWWGSQALLAEAPGLLKTETRNKTAVYIGVCNKEEDKMMYDDAVALKNLLLKHGGTNMQVLYDYLPDETHATMMHQAVYNAFKMIYPLKEPGK